MAAESSKPIQEVLSFPILFADRVIKSAREAESFKPENSELARQATALSQLLRSAALLTSASAAVYDRPIRRMSVDVTKTLDRALTLARKCRHRRTNVLHHVLSITTAADFKKVSNLLDSSLADVRWVLSIFRTDSDNGTITLTLPPFASTDPILAWVWACVAAVHSGRADAARQLAVLAAGNDRTKTIAVEENGIPPLLKMLKESGNVDAQSAAATALCNLADHHRAAIETIVDAGGVHVIVKALAEVPMAAQVTLVNLISRMLESDAECRDEFGKENVTLPLVQLLCVDVDLGDFKELNNNLHSLVEVNKTMMKLNGIHILDGSKHQCNKKDKDRESEPPEIRLALKESCASALWRLARGSSSNSKKITETKALLVLAKIVDMENTADLKKNCMKVVMELAAVAERDSELKRAAFKPSSTATKVVLDQLLRVIDEESDPALVVPAVMAIGCLATMFSAKEKRIVKSLVAQLGNRQPDVAAEATKALCKFVRDTNYNRKAHSEAIIEFGGVPKIMNLMRRNDRSHLHELVLLCNLATNAGDSKVLEQAHALVVLEGAARHAVAQNPALRELFTKAIHQLTIYQAGAHVHRQV
ncbi:uncharacterized protein LOC127252957 [Andrographis paniculata]|uniref:uncharacterized protein LOC127252957 n=1 Tax=Andrographis paniculata TaxID=175694 RepID=UPI0021E8E001|nr:uncharacterized protein LOC127252957 [Andrographis paniculata]